MRIFGLKDLLTSLAHVLDNFFFRRPNVQPTFFLD